MACLANHIQMCRQRCFWATYFVQRETCTHMPWLYDKVRECYLPFGPMDHRGPMRPQYYVHGLPSVWRCLHCRCVV